MTLHERFWQKVVKSGECWEWAAGRDQYGRGRFSLHGRNKPASRVAWLLAKGAIPAGLYVRHHCDNPRCVRPEHLFLGTAGRDWLK